MRPAKPFWAQVHYGPSCWEWMATRGRDGYGVRQYAGKLQLAHRVAWQMTIGDIPAGMCVLHRCDNPSCVRTDHLFLGTKLDNSHDCLSKGRHVGQTRTHCKNGHSFDEANTRVRPGGGRDCRTCGRLKMQQRRQQTNKESRP